tara:strand:- start:1677 stop:3389 length:1713 start_codon:yes stop_codon:yes gene_type:complete
MRAYRIYGELTAYKLEEDPYRLWSFTTWKQTELFGKVMRVAANDERRLICAVEESLHRKLKDGHTVVHPNDFREELIRLVGEELIVPAIVAANNASTQVPPRIIVRNVTKKKRAKSNFSETLQTTSENKKLYHRMFSLAGVTLMERYVEQQLKERLSNNLLAINVSDDDLDAFSMHQGKEKHFLTTEQKNAVKMVLSNAVSVVVGPAGTGKTSVLYCINDIIKNSGNGVLQVALAGKAAQRLIQQTDENAYTIKSLLFKIKYQKQQDGTHFLDSYQMPVLHIDEASMVDLQTMFQVLKAFEGRSARFVFIGDPAQLPPIGIGLVFHRIIQSKSVSKTELTKNFRCVQDIGAAANDIRNGIIPKVSANLDIEYYRGKDELLDRVNHHYLTHKDKNDIHVVAARKLTVSLINSQLHTLLTRNRDAIPVAPQFSIGDSVIYKVNDAELGLVNGSTGIVKAESMTEIEGVEVPVLVASFNGEQVMLTRRDIQDDESGTYHLQHAYGITCHAAQGSEFGAVMVVVEKCIMVERSWLYTALTRAKYKVVLLVEEDGLQAAINAGFKADNISVGLDV